MKKLNTNLVKIVNALQDGDYHDGTSIGLRLNITRSAIGKSIKKLQAYGVPITAVKGKGYALTEPLILLDKQKIQKKLTAKIALDIFETLPSTNDYLKKLTSNGLAICLSEEQTQGKSRMQRNWYSPFAQNIYFSLRYIFHQGLSELAGLSLVVSLAVLKTLRTYHPQDITAKWPNDIYFMQQKLAGILIEVTGESHGQSVAIIGIGINANMQKANAALMQTWTSLQAITGKYIDRNELVASLINQLLIYLERLNQRGFADFIEEWISADCLMHKKIVMKNFQQEIAGQAIGINQHGQLLLELADGSVRAFSSGDTSVKKNQ